MDLFGNWFSKENKEEHKRRIDKLNGDIFPYGEKQRDIVENILKDLIEKENGEIRMYNYITCKQEIAKKHNNIEGNIVEITEALKRSYMSSSKKQISKYIALVEADLKVDENLIYPSIEELNKRSLFLKI